MKTLIRAVVALLLLGSHALAQECGISNESLTVIANTAGTATKLATDVRGRLLLSNLSGVFQEDIAHTSGDRGLFVLGVANPGGASTLAATGDYTAIGVNANGNVNTHSFIYDSVLSALRPEDAAFTDGAGVSVSGYITQDPLSVDQGTSGDIAAPKVDRSGRTITTMAPAGESWQSCGTATASTSDVAIKAAVASNRIYVTSITCSSSSATTATNLNFKDGSTVIAVGGVSQMATAAPGAFSAVFPVPLRGSVNTALNFNTAVSTSSVICCGAGYVATN